MTARVAERFAAYLAQRMPAARDVEVESIARIPGGASRETYRVAVCWEEEGGERVRHGMILRRDPTSSLIDTDRELEFLAYDAVHGTEVPVPRPLYLENETRWLDRPFFVMEEIPGCQASPGGLAEPPYRERRRRIGEQKWSILGRLAALDPAELGLTARMSVPDPAECARRELAYWVGVIDADELTPQPIARAAIRWLERHPPPPAQKIALVHGDYRTGNFLYDEHGDVRAILDWEMCHLGDPLEDLAWSLDPLWSWPEVSLAGRLLPHAEAIRIWERASGLAASREALAWWQVFASLKGLAIWISSSHDFVHGENKEPIIALPGWLMTDRHNRILVDRLSPVSRRRYTEAGP